jgi:hypothetical protein
MPIERLGPVAQLLGQRGMAVGHHRGGEQAAVVDEDRRFQRKGIDLAAPLAPVGGGKPAAWAQPSLASFTR